jgi:hypothetical protein
VEAWEKRAPRRLGRAFGHAVVGHNRRASYVGGRAVRGGHYGAHPVVAPVGPEGGHELVEATLAAIGELFPKAG